MARHGEVVGRTSDTRWPAARDFSLQRQRLNARRTCPWAGRAAEWGGQCSGQGEARTGALLADFESSIDTISVDFDWDCAPIYGTVLHVFQEYHRKHRGDFVTFCVCDF